MAQNYCDECGRRPINGHCLTCSPVTPTERHNLIAEEIRRLCYTEGRGRQPGFCDAAYPNFDVKKAAEILAVFENNAS